MDSKHQLLRYIAELREEEALAAVRSHLSDGDDAIRVLKTCQEGVRLVGERYERGEYFIAGLIMGGEILRLAVEEMRPELEKQTIKGQSGTIVLGTVQGDIHDIGKNVVATLLRCHGFDVVDLGTDVSAETFVRAAAEHKPLILGLSCLLTTAVESMRSIIVALEEAGLRDGLHIIIGGSVLDHDACRFVGADYWTRDAMDGTAWCLKIGQEGSD